MNWLLMAGTLALVLEFRTSSALAAAYGIAVTGTMGITSYLYFLVCVRRWSYPVPRALAFLIPFLTIDLAFFAANAVKILAGGWFPVAVGLLVFTVMTTWWRGQKPSCIACRVSEKTPVISACDAMTAAAVASTRIGINAGPSTIA